MIRTTLDDAAEHLKELVDAALRGEDVEIEIPTGSGTVIRLTANPTQKPKRRTAGSAIGLIHMSEDFDDPLPEFEEYQ